MNPFTKLSLPLVLLTLAVQVQAQSNVSIRQEFSLNPYLVLNGNLNQTNATAYQEQGIGGGLSAGYTVLFDWIGLEMNYYFHQCDALEDELLVRYDGYSEVVSDDYSSNGFLAGIVANIPVINEGIKSYVHIGFKGGGFIAHLPDQEFTSEDGTLHYTDLRNAGFARDLKIGFKADFTDHLSANIDFHSLNEFTIVHRSSFGTIDQTQDYKWNFNYNIISLGLIFRL